MNARTLQSCDICVPPEIDVTPSSARGLADNYPKSIEISYRYGLCNAQSHLGYCTKAQYRFRERPVTWTTWYPHHWKLRIRGLGVQIPPGAPRKILNYIGNFWL